MLITIDGFIVLVGKRLSILSLRHVSDKWLYRVAQKSLTPDVLQHKGRTQRHFRRLCVRVCTSIPDRLRQCVNVEGRHCEYLRWSIIVSIVSVKFHKHVSRVT
jgi:hypothetical protein